MKEQFKQKKGQALTLANMGAIAIVLAVAIITATIGSRVLEETENSVCDDCVSENISVQGGQGMQQFAEFMSIIGLISVAGVVLGVIRQLLV